MAPEANAAKAKLHAAFAALAPKANAATACNTEQEVEEEEEEGGRTEKE